MDKGRASGVEGDHLDLESEQEIIETNTNKKAETARAINIAVEDIRRALKDKDLHLTESQQGFLDWVNRSFVRIDRTQKDLDFSRVAGAPIESLVEAIRLIGLKSGGDYSNEIKVLEENSEDYFGSKFGKNHGIGLSEQEGNAQNPLTTREAYFISEPHNEQYREYLVDKFASKIPDWGNLPKEMQDYQLAMLSFGHRKILDIKDDAINGADLELLPSKVDGKKVVQVDGETAKEGKKNKEAKVDKKEQKEKKEGLDLPKALNDIRDQYYKDPSYQVRIAKLISERFDPEKWANDFATAFDESKTERNVDNLALLVSLVTQETVFQSQTKLDMVLDMAGGDAKSVGPTQISYELIQKYHKELFKEDLDNKAAKEKGMTIKDGLFYSLIHLNKIKEGYKNVKNPEELRSYIFADWNAGKFRSRNAGFQKAVGELAREKLDYDGIVGNKTEKAIRKIIANMQGDVENIEAIKQEAIKQLQEDLKLKDEIDFTKTDTWKFISKIYSQQNPGQKLRPIVADAKVSSFVAKRMPGTKSSKDFSDQASKIYNVIAYPTLMEYYNPSTEGGKQAKQEVPQQQPEIEETPLKPVDAAFDMFQDRLRIYPELQIAPNINHLAERKKIEGVKNLQQILEKIDPEELQILFHGVDKVVLSNKLGISKHGSELEIKVFHKGNDNKWIAIPGNSQKSLNSIVKQLQDASFDRPRQATDEPVDLGKNIPEQESQPVVESQEEPEVESPVVPEVEPQIEQEPESQPEQLQDVEDVEAVEAAEDAESVLANSEVHGDDPEVTTEFFKKLDIFPDYKVEGITERKVYSSGCFEIGNDYVGAVVFVEDEGKFVARGYYKSKTGGAVWRYIPAHSGRHLGKGNENKNSVVAPSELQAALADISNSGLLESGSAEEYEKALYGTSKQKTVFGPDTKLPGDEDNFTYYGIRGVQPEGVKLDAVVGDENGFNSNQIDPHEIQINNEQQRPDFSQIGKFEWVQHGKDQFTGEDRNIEIDMIPSQDKSINYMFCWDPVKKRAWIGMVELANEPIGATGLRDKWVDVGKLATPEVDHKDHDPNGYGVKIKGTNSHVDMFPNYAGKIEENQKYIAIKRAITPKK